MSLLNRVGAPLQAGEDERSRFGILVVIGARAACVDAVGDTGVLRNLRPRQGPLRSADRGRLIGIELLPCQRARLSDVGDVASDTVLVVDRQRRLAVTGIADGRGVVLPIGARGLLTRPLAGLITGGLGIIRLLGQLYLALGDGLGIARGALTRASDVSRLGLNSPLVHRQARSLIRSLAVVHILVELDSGNADGDLVVLDLTGGGNTRGLLIVAVIVLGHAHAHVAVRLGAGFVVHTAHGVRDVLRNFPAECGAIGRARHLVALLGVIEDAVVVPIDPSGDLPSALAGEALGVGGTGRCSYTAVP